MVVASASMFHDRYRAVITSNYSRVIPSLLKDHST